MEMGLSNALVCIYYNFYCTAHLFQEKKMALGKHEYFLHDGYGDFLCAAKWAINKVVDGNNDSMFSIFEASDYRLLTWTPAIPAHVNHGSLLAITNCDSFIMTVVGFQRPTISDRFRQVVNTRRTGPHA
ncbi:MAG: hypothetical protein ACI915_001995 [Gammaproteobacteria bacterium]|jgi:hypothetical protein